MAIKVKSDVVALMDEFLKPVRSEKLASEEGATKRKAMDSEYKQSKEKDEKEIEGEVGAPGKEETEDAKKGFGDAKPAIEAEQPKSADSGSTVGELDSDEPVDKSEIGHKETKAEDDPIADNPEPLEKDAMFSKKAYIRNTRLATKIMDTLQKEAAAVEQAQKEAAAVEQAQKEAAAPKEPSVMSKLAALKDKYVPKMTAKQAAEFELGRRQREQDENELVALGMPKQAASALLGKIAQEDETLVAPPEAVPDQDVEMMEQAAVVQELLDAGVSPEEIIEASGVTEEELIEGLAQAGITPEDLEAMAAQQGGMAPGMDPGMAPGMAPGMDPGMDPAGVPGPEEMMGGGPEEEAIAELLEAGVPPEEIEQALIG